MFVCSGSRLVFALILFLSLLFQSLDASGGETKLAVFQKDSTQTGITVRIYEPPGKVNDQRTLLARETLRKGGDIIDADACGADASPENELILLTRRAGGAVTLHTYRSSSEEGQAGFRLIASDRSIGRNVEFATVGNFDADPDCEVAVLARRPDGAYRLRVYDMPAMVSGDMGKAIAGVPNMGRNIVALASADMDQDGRDDLIVVRKRADGKHRVQIYGCPRIMKENIGKPIFGFRDIGERIALKGIAVGDFDSDSEMEMAVLRSKPDGEHDLEIFDPPVVRGDNVGAPIASFSNVGRDIISVAAYRLEEEDVQGLLPQEKELMELINAERRKQNLSPVKMDSALCAAARRHSDDMAANNFFSHRGSDGSDPPVRMRDAGYIPRLYGENIAAGYSTPQEVMNGWMNSSGHRANILNRYYCDLGVGYVYRPGSSYRHYWTLDLGCR